MKLEVNLTKVELINNGWLFEKNVGVFMSYMRNLTHISFLKRPNIDRFFPGIIFVSDIVIEDVIHGCLGYPAGRFCKQFCL